MGARHNARRPERSGLLTRLRGKSGIPKNGLGGLWTYGPDRGLNPGAKWYDRAENLLVWSEDLSEWTVSGTPVVAATTVEDDDGAVSEYIHQTVAAADATTWTWTLWVLQDAVAPATRFPSFRVFVSDNYAVKLDTSTGASTETSALNGSHTVTSDGDYWRVEITFTTDDANGIQSRIYPAVGANSDLTTGSAAAVGEITILRQQLTPGTSSGTYRATEARQRVWDWSGNARHAQVGSDALAAGDAQDPGDGLWANPNLLADGSSEDLENAAWGHTATTDDATLLTFTGQNQYFTQEISTLDGVYYTISCKIRNISGNTALHLRHYFSESGNWSAVTVDGVLTRYSVTVLGKSDGGNVAFGIMDTNAAGHGQIEVTEWQLEVGALSDYFPPGRMIVAARGDFDGVDDYSDVSSLPLAGDWTFVAVIRPEDITSRGLFRNGVASPNISLDSNGKLSYAGGSTVVATDAVETDQWQTIAVTKLGTTITFYVNGVANGSGTSGSGNAFTALRIGYDGSTYFDGIIPFFLASPRAFSWGEIKRLHELIRMWWNLDRRNKRNLNMRSLASEVGGFDEGFDEGFR